MSCLGFVGLATAGSDKVPNPVAIPVTAPVLSGVSDSAFYFVTVPGGCTAGGFYSDNGALYRWVPTQKSPTLLLGGNVNGGTVLDATTLGQD